MSNDLWKNKLFHFDSERRQMFTKKRNKKTWSSKTGIGARRQTNLARKREFAYLFYTSFLLILFLIGNDPVFVFVFGVNASHTRSLFIYLL